MKKFTFFLAFAVLTLGLFAQKHTTKVPYQVGPKVHNTLNNTTNVKSILGVLSYDNGEIQYGLGNASAHTIEVYHQYPASMITSLVGQSITHFTVGIDDPSGYTKMNIRILEESIDATPVIDDEMTIGDLAAGMNVFELTDAYVIPADKDIFVGVYFESAGGYGIAVDTDGSPAPEYSSLFYFNGAYQGSIIAAGYNDFIVRGIVTDDGTLGGSLIDLAIVNANTTTEGCTLSTTEAIEVTLKNNGEEKINEKFYLTVEINDSPVSLQVSPTGFDPGTEMSVSMESWDMSTAGSYEIFVSHDFADHVLYNNTLTKTISTGDAQITINLTTDDWASETSWALIDQDGNEIATNGALSNATNYVTDICVNSAGCYTWIISDSYGDGISEVGGTFTISYNGTVIGTCPEGGNFGSEYSVLGLGDGCPDNDVEFVSLDLYKYAGKDTDLFIKGTIFSKGSQSLTTLDVSYTIDGGSAVTETLTGLSFTGQYQFTLSNALNFDAVGDYDLIVTISNPNGEADASTDDNEQSVTLSILEYAPTKRIFGEEATGTWCGWCPRGAVFMDYMAETYPETWVGIAVHNGDPMVVTEYDNGIGGYIGGYPSGLIDRAGEFDPSQFEAVYLERIEYVAPVDIKIENINYNEANGALSFDVAADFLATVEGARFNAMIVENGVTGTTSGYNQTNYYSGGGNGDMGGFEDLANPVPAADMVYDHVGRALLGGWNGVSGSISATVSAGETESYTFTTTINSAWDASEIEIIGVIMGSNDEVLNVVKGDLITGIFTQKANTANFNVYPNPFSNEITLSNLKNASEIIVSNVLGKTISTIKVNGLSQVISTSNLEDGIYLITVVDNNHKSSTVRVVKQ